ncbi:HAD family phosphatase [Pseudoalteromonas sp. NEC-BIFX-2020_015]|uniref:HAD family hydrolase n=1 Tax=Pseudoalteromonas sp. NEC-BIFX-2020_015 TaxID=2729544 RepID=UPI0014616A15|nr:HAD family phosphatase [Pseudoalteromonas sp. NEC-BIFX-2020_015]NMR26932.1 HAD family phosphatase [Pseudoalteromonas sp. NEC-BIFX-2020_015]
MTLKAVLFDMDGTLVDSESVHFNCWNDVLAKYGICYEEDEFCQRFSGKATLEAAKEVVAHYQLDITPKALAKAKYDYFSEFVSNHLPPLMPYAKEVLLAVKQSGLKMALVTGSARAEALPILKGYGFYTLFDCVVTKDDVVNPKPAADPYLLALNTLNITAQNAIAIEDTHTGVTAAYNAQVRVMAIPNKHTLNHDLSKATVRFENLQQLWQWVQIKL